MDVDFHVEVRRGCQEDQNPQRFVRRRECVHLFVMLWGSGLGVNVNI